MSDFDSLAARLRTCRLCRDEPLYGQALAHEPRPIVQGGTSARLCIASQAPGTRAHACGLPFKDPSGNRLREWLQIDEATFYDPSCIAIIPMGSCFPGHDKNGGDLPPRKECALTWRPALFEALPNLDLILVIGRYAQTWHLPKEMAQNLTETVRRWQEILDASQRPRILPLPHPSWRNNRWLARHPWFQNELLPALRHEVHALLQPTGGTREA